MIITLKKAYQHQTLCEIYTNTEEPDKFSVGYVLAIDKQNCVALLVDFYGQYDGLSCFSIDEIYQIQFQTKYLQAIEKLIKFRGIVTKKDFHQDNLFINMLLDIKNNHRICQIELCDSNCVDITGYVNEINTNNSTIEFCLVNNFGNNDGESIVDMQMISYLSYDTTDTVRLEILNN